MLCFTLFSIFLVLYSSVSPLLYITCVEIKMKAFRAASFSEVTFDGMICIVFPDMLILVYTRPKKCSPRII